MHGRYKAKSVAKQRGLYSLKDEAGKRDNSIERDFFAREIDDPAAIVHRLLLTEGVRALCPADRIVWGRFILAQMFRVPRMMDSLRSRGAEVLRQSFDESPQAYEEIKSVGDAPTLARWVNENLPMATGDNFALATLPSIVDSELLHDVMKKAHWGTIDL